jgi:stage II sporulation protein E
MIYKNEIVPYRRSLNDKKIEEKKKIKYLSIGSILFFLSAFFTSRVFILDTFMPFGIAFFLAVYGILDRKLAVATGFIGILGYLTTFEGYKSISRMVVLITLVILALIFNNNDKNRIVKMYIAGFFINLVVIIVFRGLFIAIGFSIFDSILALGESIIMAASAYIFSYGIPLYFDHNKRKILSREEMIYIGIMLGIIVSGMYDIKYMSFSLKNILGFLIVLVMGYSEGGAMGAATGVSLGLISTISDSTMPIYLGIYAFSGLISGVFRELGKLTTGIAFLVACALMAFYTAGLINVNIGVNLIFYNSLVAGVLFMIIPSKNYEKLSALINDEKRTVQLQKSYIERVKDIMTLKLFKISSTLSGLSNILEESIESELSNKVEIDGLVEKLADRVCFNCDSKNLCWRRDMYYTYDSFLEVLRIIEKNGSITAAMVPDSLNRKCIRPNELSKQANSIFEIFRLDNKWKRKLVKSRLVLSEQIKDMSGLVRTMIEEASTSMEFKNDIEEEIAISLDKKGLDFDDILAVKNNRNRYEVTLYRKPCAGQQNCNKDFVSSISKTLGVRMVRENTKCKINKDCSMCQFRLVEAENYNVTTAIARCSKEEISGDNYSFGEVGEGRYMVALSDGMGSGPRANNESSITISLLEKFIEAGYERNAAIKATNSVLVFRANNESYATIDLGIIDMYDGIGEFIKIGSAPTFIKSGMDVSVLNSTTLPAGILEDIEIESEIIEFKNGDMVVMVTDGITDADREAKERWVVKLLKEYDSVNPKEIADHVLMSAKEKYGGRIKDDMTVLVLKIWKLM